MKTEIYYQIENDQIAEMVPLFAKYAEHSLDNLDGYSVWLSDNKPIAYHITVEDQSAIVAEHLVTRRIKDGSIVRIDG